MAVPDPLPVIQATLAPAFLMTGGGIFLNFVQARLFRVNDHLRRMGAEPARDARHERLVALGMRRGRILRNAIVFGVLALGLIVATMLALLAGTVLPAREPGALVVTLFGLGLASFAAALFLGVHDTLLSFRSLQAEFGQADQRPGGP
ncbi:MAG TPA: DUF2721 domain-containing protein [Candidatus Thermoplasmatota archaeon]|nr:DUF2721 domain-containing protein [Candidatus Thermoplasmatota archaeon]